MTTELCTFLITLFGRILKYFWPINESKGGE